MAQSQLKPTTKTHFSTGCATSAGSASNRALDNDGPSLQRCDINFRVEQLEYSSDRIRQAIFRLASRLKPVLLPESPANGIKGETGDSNISTLSIRLDNLNDSLLHNTELLAELLDRVDFLPSDEDCVEKG